MDRALPQTRLCEREGFCRQWQSLSVSRLSNRFHPGDETLLEFTGVSLAKTLLKGIVRWDSVRQFQESAQPVRIASPPLHFSEVLGLRRFRRQMAMAMISIN